MLPLKYQTTKTAEKMEDLNKFAMDVARIHNSKSKLFGIKDAIDSYWRELVVLPNGLRSDYSVLRSSHHFALNGGIIGEYIDGALVPHTIIEQRLSIVSNSDTVEIKGVIRTLETIPLYVKITLTKLD